MKRKTIAVCVTGYDWEYETRVVDGIYERCKEFDINLLVFATLTRKPELNSNRTLPESIIRGEVEIFNLINYNLIDGIIILGDSLIEESVIYDIAKKSKQHNIPIININDVNHSLYRNVILSDKIAMEFVVRHLVEDHGFTKINFIGGFPGNLQTEERLLAYKKVLTEHNIPIEEDRIAYGEFWKKSAECTAQFLQLNEIPQAIVCASDTMAFFCMDYLKENGYKIPDDIVVTGFDGIKDCELYNPTLTTVRRAFQKSGSVAVDIIRDIWDGKDTPVDTSVNSMLVKNQSCGCIPVGDSNNINFYNSRYGEQDSFKEFNTYILEMNTRFSSAKNSTELYIDTKRGAEFFNLKKLYICICSNIENGELTFNNYETISNYSGISDTMVSMVQYGHDIPIGMEFPSSQLIPENFLDGNTSIFYAFSPLYFKNRFLGYLAYEPTKTHGFGDYFATWVMSISNNAGSFYMNNELENLYMRDPLTGLYNRRGMTRLGGTIIQEAKESGNWITIICADIDNLKPINDNYGHEAGDNAILRTAKAIEYSMPKNSVCVRTGGDEYCVILSHDNPDKIKDYISNIDTYLDEYNKVSGLPYKVGCSCGYYSIFASELTTIDQMIKIADTNMYKIKAKKKTNR